jgi:hypothetical protein
MTGSVAKRAVVVYQNQNACKVQVMTPHSTAPSARKSGQVMIRTHVPKLGDSPDFLGHVRSSAITKLFSSDHRSPA